MTRNKTATNGPKLEDAGHFFAVGRQFADEVVVTDVKTAVATTGQCDWSHEARLIDVSIATSTVNATCAAITQHGRHPPWTLLQVDVSTVTFVQDTYSRCNYTRMFTPPAGLHFHDYHHYHHLICQNTFSCFPLPVPYTPFIR